MHPGDLGRGDRTLLGESHRLEHESGAGEPPRIAKSGPTMPFDPLVWLTRLTLGALALNILVDAVAVVSDIVYYRAADSLFNGNGSLADAAAAEDTQATIGVVVIVVFLLTAVVFLFWFNALYANLRRLGIDRLRYSDGWAVGAWFVPFLNFVRPKRIADDIWRGSDPDLPAQADLPGGSVPWYLWAWWLLFLVEGFFARYAFARSEGDTADSLLNAAKLDVVADAGDIVVAILAIVVVRALIERQRARARRLSAQPPP